MSRTAAALRAGPVPPAGQPASDGQLYGGLVGGLIGEIEDRLIAPGTAPEAPAGADAAGLAASGPPDLAHRASVAAGYLGLAAASAATVAGLARLF